MGYMGLIFVVRHHGFMISGSNAALTFGATHRVRKADLPNFSPAHLPHITDAPPLSLPPLASCRPDTTLAKIFEKWSHADRESALAQCALVTIPAAARGDERQKRAQNGGEVHLITHTLWYSCAFSHSWATFNAS